MAEVSREKSTFVLGGIALLAVLSMFFEPGRVPLFEPDEGRYAEIPREMRASGDWVVPRLNGVVYLEKPPLHYWLVAASFEVFGESAGAARLPSKLASAGMVLATWLFVKRRANRRTAAIAAVVSATGAMVFSLSRLAIIDPSFSCALSLAAFAFAAFQEADAAADRVRARRALWGLHAALAFAVLLKGLAAIALLGGAILLFAAVTGRWRLVPRLFAPGPLTLFLALAAPWHVLAARREPDFLRFYFVHEHLERYLETGHHREGAPWYFVAVLIGGFLPWTAFFGRLRSAWPGFARLRDPRSGTTLFLFLWAGFLFLFFSASRSKLIPYVEPAWPAIAVLLAFGIGAAESAGTRFAPERFAATVWFALLAAGAFVTSAIGLPERIAAVEPVLPVVGGAAVVALVVLILDGVSNRPDLVRAVAGGWVLVLASLLFQLGPFARATTSWPLTEALLRELGPDDIVLQRGSYLQALPFYARRVTPIAAFGGGELEYGRDLGTAPASFLGEKEFDAVWNGTRRVFVATHFGSLDAFTNRARGLVPHRHVAATPDHKFVLLCNRPPAPSLGSPEVVASALRRGAAPPTGDP